MRLLKCNEVKAKRGCEHSKLYSEVRDGAFPPPVKDGRQSLWPEDEVEAVLRYLVAGKSRDQIRALVRSLVEQRERRVPV